MQEKLQKINIWYLLGYILGPAAIAAASIGLGALLFSEGGTGAVITFMFIPILAVIWWIFAGAFIFKKKTTPKLAQEFKAQGYKANQTFYGRGKTVMLDIDKGMLGLAFYWNPFQVYIIPASRVKKAWTDDGKMGSGFMEGSSRVSFLCTIDDIKIRVDTFTSNQRFRMDDKHILTGISKADLMVKSIEEAKTNSEKAKTSAKAETKDKSESKSTKSETKAGK